MCRRVARGRWAARLCAALMGHGGALERRARHLLHGNPYGAWISHVGCSTGATATGVGATRAQAEFAKG
eukprot:5423257-Prymnesium_polylepis.1